MHGITEILGVLCKKHGLVLFSSLFLINIVIYESQNVKRTFFGEYRLQKIISLQLTRLKNETLRFRVKKFSQIIIPGSICGL